ncbi:MAG: hypothetical protein QOC54_3796, partial [Baekduia sp.]|nr:hypothetical protein [Baekduia sp.]
RPAAVGHGARLVGGEARGGFGGRRRRIDGSGGGQGVVPAAKAVLGRDGTGGCGHDPRIWPS